MMCFICVSEKIQWVQCEDCFKWRKLPANALLPSKWTCSANSLDPERYTIICFKLFHLCFFEHLIPFCSLKALIK